MPASCDVSKPTSFERTKPPSLFIPLPRIWGSHADLSLCGALLVVGPRKREEGRGSAYALRPSPATGILRVVLRVLSTASSSASRAARVAATRAKPPPLPSSVPSGFVCPREGQPLPSTAVGRVPPPGGLTWRGGVRATAATE